MPATKFAPPERRFKGASGTGLSQCAQLYAKAQVNPWGEFDELPCVPCAPADMTKRFRAINRGSFASSGTTGVGFVTWSPLCAASNVNAANWSTTAFAGTSFAVGGVAGVSSGGKSTLPYLAVDFSTAGDFFTARLVASVMRVVNTTAPLYRSGSITASRMPTGLRLGDLSAANVQSTLESIKVPANHEDFMYWAFVPQDEEDFDFPDGAITYTADGVGNRAAQNYGLLFQGGALTPNTSTFDWELVEFWEFTGVRQSKTVDSLQKSHADPVGHARVLEAISVPRQSLDVKDVANNVGENIVNAMAHSDTVAKTVEDLLGMAGLSLGKTDSLVTSLAKMFMQ